MADPVEQYLSRYAEPEAQAELEGRWDRCVVVPLRDEDASFVDGVRPLGELGRLLVIAVINGPEETSANTQLLLQLAGRAELSKPRHVQREGLDIVVVDRASAAHTFSDRDGVGLARKIGLDLGLALWRRGQLLSPWLRTTDADACLSVRPADPSPTGCVACIAPYWHAPSSNRAVDRATARYEVWLRHYVAGLAYARSDWAYATIGSTLDVDATAYAMVRGVPQRQAGEDFHLLAKLAKLGAIHHGGRVEVTLRSRVSDRVPFGTGPAVAKAVDSGEDRRVYDPVVFDVLREVTTRLDALCDPETFESAWDELPAVAQAALRHQGMIAAAKAIFTVPRPLLRRRRLREWFDARRTLRFVHQVRDAGHPDLPWPTAVGRAPWSRDLQVDPAEDDLAALRRHLAALAPLVAGLGRGSLGA